MKNNWQKQNWSIQLVHSDNPCFWKPQDPKLTLKSCFKVFKVFTVSSSWGAKVHLRIEGINMTVRNTDYTGQAVWSYSFGFPHLLQMFRRTLQRRFVVKLQKRRADNESHHFLKVKPPSNFHIYSFSRHNSEKLLRSRLCKMVLFSFLPPSIWIRATAAVSLPMFVLHHVVWSVHCLTVYLLEYKTLLF